jgi:hypothetical protein
MNDQKNQDKNKKACEPVKHNGKPAASRVLNEVKSRGLAG